MLNKIEKDLIMRELDHDYADPIQVLKELHDFLNGFSESNNKRDENFMCKCYIYEAKELARDILDFFKHPIFTVACLAEMYELHNRLTCLFFWIG